MEIFTIKNNFKEGWEYGLRKKEPSC